LETPLRALRNEGAEQRASSIKHLWAISSLLSGGRSIPSQNRPNHVTIASRLMGARDSSASGPPRRAVPLRLTSSDTSITVNFACPHCSAVYGAAQSQSPEDCAGECYCSGALRLFTYGTVDMSSANGMPSVLKRLATSGLVCKGPSAWL
jgi:hypothetical protein